MKRLFLVRHAEAVPTWESGGSDFDRPLSQRGRTRFESLIQQLTKETVHPDCILHSPKLRAVQTAELLATQLEIAESRIDSVTFLGQSYTVETLREQLEQRSDEQIALVAHQPTLGWMVNELTGGQLVAFSPGTIVQLDFETGWSRASISQVWECR